MSKQRVTVTGEKQTFLIRVIIKKLQDVGLECGYVDLDIDALNSNMVEDSLIILYMDEGDRPGDEVLHFIVDQMLEIGGMIIPIGEKNDVRYIKEHVPEDLIYTEFYRPVKNEELVATVDDFFKKVESGEFRKSILVVDDDPSYLNLVRGWLSGTYKVSMATSGLKAIKWLGKNRVDLILLDHEMPVTSGPQVLEMLRSDPETESIPVMFLTGKSDKQSVMAVLSLKPEGYFLKTIEKDELLKNLNSFFEKKKSKSEMC